MSKKLQPSSEFNPIFNRLIIICEKKNTTVSNLIDMVESSRSAINAWKKGNIAANVLPQITQLLNISFDYLLTGKEKSPSPELTEEEQKCLEVFDRLEPDDRIRFIAKMEQRYEDYSSEFSEELTPEVKKNVS